MSLYYPPSIRPTTIPPALAHLTPEDQQIFFKYSFGPTRPIPFPVVHHAFEWHVQQQPNAICVEHEAYGHRMTYAQIDKLSNRLARRIKEVIFGKEASSSSSGQQTRLRPAYLRICILARRSVYFVIAILAVLKSAAQYVPIDAATITDSSLRHIINDSDPEMVLVMEEFVPRLEAVAKPTDDDADIDILYRVPQVCLEQAIEEDEALNVDDTKPEDPTKPEDGCYIIYTSGTTGVPKGVDVRHIGVSNVICAPPGNVHMKPGMRVAHLLNIAFDMGAWEILSSLYNGCTLCMRGNTFKEWVRLLKSVDVIISTPSILARHDPVQYPNIKHVIVGGEMCPQLLADSWAQHTQFSNCCGPTEISVCNTIQPHTSGYSLSIGTPIPNTSVYILDQDYDPSERSSSGYPTSPFALPIGQTGSMWVGGIGVSKGYLNLPCKTAERWLPDPFRNNGNNEDTTYMMFNTNDLGRWRPDGQLEHCGRADDQVKVKGGFRVELDGVASAMMRCERVVSAAVALLVDGVLWGFVRRRERKDVDVVGDGEEEGEGEEEEEIKQVKKRTMEVMSYYAVPERWMIMDEFPTTRNGKVDKRVLVCLAKERERKDEKLTEVEKKESQQTSQRLEEEAEGAVDDDEESGKKECDENALSSGLNSTSSSWTSISSISIPTTPTDGHDDPNPVVNTEGDAKSPDVMTSSSITPTTLFAFASQQPVSSIHYSSHPILSTPLGPDRHHVHARPAKHVDIPSKSVLSTHQLQVEIVSTPS